MTEVAQSLALYKSKFEGVRQESVTSNFDVCTWFVSWLTILGSALQDQYCNLALIKLPFELLQYQLTRYAVLLFLFPMLFLMFLYQN